VQDGVRPATLPVAPSGPAGTVVYGRNARSGVFHDETAGLAAASLRGPDRITILRGVTTCCMAWSGARSLLTIGTTGASGSGLGVVTVGSDTYRPLAFGSQSRGLIPGGWSADGAELAVSRPRMSGHQAAGVYIARFGADTFERVSRTPAGEVDRVLSMSPDGSRLLIFRTRGGGSPGGGDGMLYTLGITRHGARLARLSPPHSYSWCCYYGAPASWSPGGRRVVFAAFQPRTAGDESRSAVFVANADGTNKRRITRWGGWTTSARWSPSGDWIVFDRVNRGPGLHDLFITRPDGSDAHVVTPGLGDAGGCCAQWSSDSRYLIYERGADDQHQALYIVNIQGRPISRRLTGSTGSYLSFVVTGDTGR
jgi:dipeptidyl aminopeptidase/acylaminoacyl peptidase